MITLQKSQVWLNMEASSDHPDAIGKIPVYLTKKDAEIAAYSIGWNKSDVCKVKIDSGLYRQAWAIVNAVGGEYQVFKIGQTNEKPNIQQIPRPKIITEIEIPKLGEIKY